MTIGQRIKLSRRAAGLSLRELGARIDNRVTAQAISKYERGEAMPGSGVLIALADALGVSVDYLASDNDIVLEAVDFRRKRLTGKREEAQVEARVLHLLERYLAVEEILGLPSAVWRLPREAPWPVLRDPAEAEQAALGLRIHWGLGLDPIPNLVELLEERGIKVLSMALSNIDGLTARVRIEGRSAASVIVVNRKDWGERQRFTVAHEHGAYGSGPSRRRSRTRRPRTASPARSSCRPRLFGPRSAAHRRSIGWGELFDLKPDLRAVSVQAPHLIAARTSASRQYPLPAALRRVRSPRLAQPALRGALCHEGRAAQALRTSLLPRPWPRAPSPRPRPPSCWGSRFGISICKWTNPPRSRSRRRGLSA